MTSNQQAARECQRCDYECFCGYEAMTTDRDNQQAAREWPAVACHRMVTGDPPTKWQWISGPASLGEIDRAKLYGWEIENAYLRPQVIDVIRADWVIDYLPAMQIRNWPNVKEGYEEGYRDAVQLCREQIAHAFAEWNAHPATPRPTQESEP